MGLTHIKGQVRYVDNNLVAGARIYWVFRIFDTPFRRVVGETNLQGHYESEPPNIPVSSSSASIHELWALKLEGEKVFADKKEPLLGPGDLTIINFNLEEVTDQDFKDVLTKIWGSGI